MKSLKRAIITIKRQLGKTTLLFSLFFALGVLLVGSVIVRQVVLRTTEQFWERFPGVATIYYDLGFRNEITEDEWIEIQKMRVPSEIIEEISEIGYVRSFDFSILTEIISINQRRVFNPSIENFNLNDSVIRSLEDYFGVGDDEPFVFQELYGIHQVEFSSVASGSIAIVSGDVFTQNQLDNGELVAIVSDEFARENNLQVGSIMKLDSNTFDYRELMVENAGSWWRYVTDESNYLQIIHVWEIEIIGIYEVNQVFDYENEPWRAASAERRRQNRIYLPNNLVEEIGMMTFNANQYYAPLLFDVDLDFSEVIFYQVFFVLNDSRDFPKFKELANEILPEGRIIASLSNNFYAGTMAMNNMTELSEFVLSMSIGATVILSVLVLLIFISDRRKEIGILISLGEKRMSIIVQQVFEVLIILIGAISMAILVGHYATSHITNQLVENQLTQQLEMQSQLLSGNNVPFVYTPAVLEIFNSGPLGLEEMIEMYHVSIDIPTISIILILSITTVMIATSAPIILILRLSPKKMLMD